MVREEQRDSTVWQPLVHLSGLILIFLYIWEIVQKSLIHDLDILGHYSS